MEGGKGEGTAGERAKREIAFLGLLGDSYSQSTNAHRLDDT